MRLVIISVASACLMAATSGFACQVCVILGVDSATGRVVKAPNGDPLPSAVVKLREALHRRKRDTSILSCLGGFRRGRVVRSTTTKPDGTFDLGHVKPGSYWLIIKAKDAQVVRVIELGPSPMGYKSSKVVDYVTSEDGLVDNMCDVLQAKDFI